MLRKKLSAVIIVAIMTNLAATPLSVLAETLTTNNVIQEDVNQLKEAKVTKIDLTNSQYKDKYNDVFKINNEKIASISNNGGQYASSSIDRAIDGNLNTHWETGKENTNNFTNEVEFKFTEEITIDKILYLARRDASGKGFAKEFEIYSSLTDNEDDFKLISDGSYNGSTLDTIEIKFNPTKFKRLKFKFKNAYNNWASAAEFMFYKEDSILDKVKNLFKDNTMADVSQEFNSIDKVNLLEQEFKNHPLYNDYKENFENARILLNQESIVPTEAQVSKFDTYYSDYRQAYDEVFKMSNTNIDNVYANGGYLNYYSTISNMTDGNLDTYWETGKGTTDSFKNELIFTLKENTVLNRIAYRSAWNTVGFAENFEIWASNTTKGDTFQLVTSATASKTADLVEIKFNPTSFKRIKFIFKNNGTATASEFMFYKEDKGSDQMAKLFTDSTLSKVNEEFNSLDKLNKLEESVKTHPLYTKFKESIADAKAIVENKEVETTTAITRKITYGENDEYNKLYKVSMDNIESITNNGGHYWNQVINNAIDGKLDTYWETNTANNNNFNNEVEVTFKEPVKINRVVYAPRQSDLKGFAQEFEIYASRTSQGDTYQLVAAGTSSKVSGLVEAKFNETEFKRLKFKFKKSDQNWASLSEIIFYQKDEVYEKVNNIFTNGLMNELTENANTLEKIQALENELVNYPLKEDYTSRIELAKKILENPSKYQEGILTASQRGDSNKEASQHQIARTSYNLDTFGKYVTPGEIISVYVDADEKGVMPKLVFGQLANDKNGWTRFYDLKPGLNTIIAPQFNNMSPAVIYVYNPALPSDQAYAPKVRLEGGTAFPVYYHGVTDPAEYEKELEEYNKKISTDDNDFANGLRDDVYYNVTELVSENNLITTSAAGAIKGIKEMKSANKTVKDTMDDWEKMWYEFQKFSGFVEGDEDPRNDLFNVKFISRVFTKGPTGWSDWGYTGYNGGNATRRDTGTFKNIVKPFSIGDDWLYFHEWGHNINNSSTEYTEVTNNLYSAQLRRVFGTGGKDDRIDWNTLYSRFSGNTVSLGFWTSLGMISQPLYYYGTDTYGKASRIARTNPDGILNGLTSNQQRLVITYSLAVGYDLTDFFDGWGYCKATDLMKSKVSNLPKPTVKLEYMNTSGIDYKGEGFTDETNVNINSFSANSELKQNTITFSVDEKDKNDIMGYEILRDGEVVGYTVSNSFVDKNIDVNKDYTYEIVAYAKNLTTSKKVAISSKTPTLISNEKITIKLNEEFNPLEYVNSFDYLGNNIEDIKVTNNVDTTKKGIYNASYEVVSNGIKVAKNSVVEVVSDYDYLSDSDWTSASTQYDTVRKNNDLKLLVNGKVKSFNKGFGIHANGEIVYDLSGKNYDKFEAFVGVSRSISAQNNSSIIFSILADGSEIYNSGLMKYETQAKYVSVDIKGVKELKIVINDGGNGISSDHGVIGNPILTNNNVKPILEVGKDESIELRSEYNLMDSVEATDIEDGILTDSVSVNDNGFNTNKTGEYTIEYSVKDSDGNIANASKKVLVYSEKKYLSDTDWISARTDYGSVRKDKASVNSNIKLLLNGEVKEFTKGIGTHANSEIVYNLEGKNYEYFETYVGVDRNIQEQNNSSIIFKIYADGVEVYNSGLMKYNTEAKFVRIPVNGVKELKLVVDNAGNGNSSDHADFGDAKFLITNSIPKLTIPESISTTLGHPIDINQEYSASDIEDGNLTDNVKVEGSVNFDKTGKYEITYTVVDSDGNKVVKTRTIAVVDMNDYNYLTDLNWKSVSYSYTTPVKDSAISGGAIKLTNEDGREVTFNRGIGSHATSTITYDLSSENYSYFTSYIGVNRNMYNSIASIEFQVYVDGVLKYTSGLMTSKMPMKFVQVDINDAKELKLVVTDGGNGIGSDHGAWGDTKLHYAKENGASINRRELSELIKTVSELDSKIYTEDSFNNLTLVLKDVNTNLADGYNQEEIDKLYNNLKQAYDALVKATDFSALKEVISKNSNLNELHYYKDAITAHKALVEEAKKVLANENATQEEIDKIVAKINESSKKLVVRENKIELEKKIKEAKEIKNDNYQKIRWDNFLWGIDYAEGIYKNIDATDANISSALFTLEYMKGELK